MSGIWGSEFAVFTLQALVGMRKSGGPEPRHTLPFQDKPGLAEKLVLPQQSHEFGAEGEAWWPRVGTWVSRVDTGQRWAAGILLVQAALVVLRV